MAILIEQADVIRRPRPDAVRLKGLVGERVDASRLNRLRHQEEYHLLWPFQEHCPVGWPQRDAPHPEITRGDWQGEFIGTWVDAASTAAWHAGDCELRSKIDALVKDWLATQEEDGYLGTYDDEDRWKSWDVWVQAHDLIGLLGYYGYAGSEEALKAAVRVADRVLQDFGPGRQSLHVGPRQHVFRGNVIDRGMSSSAILEPLIWLYWGTEDQRYLQFGRWLVDEDWEAPGGIAFISSLLGGRGVADTGTGKAAQMMINFTGMAELYRATGEERYLKPVLIAWDDIVQHHLYITGSASTGEHFRKDYVLRNDGQYRLGETCVTMTWLYLNLSLGRLTGEARFFDMVEQTLYNHLLGAQSPDGRGWAYYMGLRDSKRYRWHTDPDCCPKRGSRALAQMPEHLFGIDDSGLVVNFYEPAAATLTLFSGLEVGIDLEGRYPFDGLIRAVVRPTESSEFRVRLRLPGWCKGWRLSLNGAPQDVQPDDTGYFAMTRTWAAGDVIELEMDMPARTVVDDLGNVGRAAVMRGPLVYAADSSYLPEGRLLDDVILALDGAEPAKSLQVVGAENDSVHVVVATVVPQPGTGVGVWKEKERYYDLAACGDAKTLEAKDLELVPFFEAGNRDPDSYRDGVSSYAEPATKVTYQVWLPYTCD